MKNYEITIWETSDCREEGVSYHLDPLEFDLNTLEEIKGFVINCYVDEYIMKMKGSIEVCEFDEKNEWIRTICHISEDSNDELKIINVR